MVAADMLGKFPLLTYFENNRFVPMSASTTAFQGSFFHPTYCIIAVFILSLVSILQIKLVAAVKVTPCCAPNDQNDP